MSTGSSNASPSGGFWSGSTGQVSVRSTDSRIGDPPRQAREGWEWVWFPEGYWAERQLERRSSTKDSSGSQGSHSSQIQGTKTKVFRWTPRGSRSPRDQSDPPERPEPEQLNLSPKTVLPPNQNAFSHFTPPKHLPSSPYMSEEAQTLSLQNPDKKNKTTSEKLDTWTRFNSMTPPVTDLISPGSRPPTQPIRSKPSWRAFQKHREASHRLSLTLGDTDKLTVSRRKNRKRKRTKQMIRSPSSILHPAISRKSRYHLRRNPGQLRLMRQLVSPKLTLHRDQHPLLEVVYASG